MESRILEEIIEMSDQEVRVSVAHLGIIPVHENILFLSSPSSSKPVISLPGGAKRCTDEQREYLENKLGAVFQEKRDGNGKSSEVGYVNDLRLGLPAKNFGEFHSWYLEAVLDSLESELYEELAVEQRILDSIEGFRTSHIATVYCKDKTFRKGTDSKRTQYILEVHNVGLDSHYQEKISGFAKSEENDGSVFLIPMEEMKEYAIQIKDNPDANLMYNDHNFRIGDVIDYVLLYADERQTHLNKDLSFPVL